MTEYSLFNVLNIKGINIIFYKILFFVSILTIAFGLAKLSRKAVINAFYKKKRAHCSSSYAAGRLTYFFILFLGVYVSLTIIGT